MLRRYEMPENGAHSQAIYLKLLLWFKSTFYGSYHPLAITLMWRCSHRKCGH
jgi:hypothetical protein